MCGWVDAVCDDRSLMRRVVVKCSTGEKRSVEKRR